MEKTLKRKSNLVACVLIFIVVCLGIVFAGDVVVKEGTLEAENVDATATIEAEVFKSTGCTATGMKAVAFGENTEANGDYSTAMGYGTTASGDFSTTMGYGTTASSWGSTAMGRDTTASGELSTAMGRGTNASGLYSTAMGNGTEASGLYSTAMGFYTTAGGVCSTAMGFYTNANPYYSSAFGKYCTNDIANSFAVGYGDYRHPKVDFRVESDLVTVTEDLYVGDTVDANAYLTHSSFYDNDTYGKALDYAEDSSKTIKVNAQGQKEYNHEADPAFLKKWVAVKDYDKYTDKQVWNEDLQEYEPVRIYETHQELRTDLGMQVAWLRQCVFELKQENQMLKDQLQTLKDELSLK